MPRLIIPVLAMSALITAADLLLSDAKAAPHAERAGAVKSVPEIDRGTPVQPPNLHTL